MDRYNIHQLRSNRGIECDLDENGEWVLFSDIHDLLLGFGRYITANKLTKEEIEMNIDAYIEKE